MAAAATAGRLAGAPASGRARGAAVAAHAPRHRRRARPLAANAAADADGAPAPGQPAVALLIEVDGALVDVVQQGHRVAFNRAFAECGVAPGAAWDPPAFEAALRAVPALGGTGEALVSARLDRAGAWPPSLSLSDGAAADASNNNSNNSSSRGGAAGSPPPPPPPSARQAFARRVHEAKLRAFGALLSAGQLPLRPDVASVVDAALAAGAVVALVAETASAPDEGVAAAALGALGEGRAARVRVLTAGARRPRDEGDDGGSGNGGEGEDDDGMGGGGGGLGGGGALKAAVARQKAQAAREFAAAVKALRGAGGGPLIDVSALTGSGSAPPSASSPDGLSPAFFSASAALLGASPARCVCVCATVPAVRAAAAAGMVAVAVPRQAAFDACFPEARAKFEAFGPGYVTWARLAGMVAASSAAAAAAEAGARAKEAR